MRNKTKWLALFALGLLGAFFNPAVTFAQEVAEVAADMEDEEEEKKVIKVRITNQNMQQLQGYVVGGPIGSPLTSRVSLGTVYAQGSKLFKLRESFVSRGVGSSASSFDPWGVTSSSPRNTSSSARAERWSGRSTDLLRVGATSRSLARSNSPARTPLSLDPRASRSWEVPGEVLDLPLRGLRLVGRRAEVAS
jgi:hypothetical protein